jgi:hypothetical protein
MGQVIQMGFFLLLFLQHSFGEKNREGFSQLKLNICHKTTVKFCQYFGLSVLSQIRNQEEGLRNHMSKIKK